MLKCRAFKRVILSDSSVNARSFRSNSEKLVASGVGGAHFGAFLPVIIEYKRATNENVINQGLYYLDWLMDHKAEFELLVLKRFGQKAADSIEWATPRLLCIAGDFTKYDGHAVQQINRNIELIRYSWFGAPPRRARRPHMGVTFVARDDRLSCRRIHRVEKAGQSLVRCCARLGAWSRRGATLSLVTVSDRDVIPFGRMRLRSLRARWVLSLRGVWRNTCRARHVSCRLAADPVGCRRSCVT